MTEGEKNLFTRYEVKYNLKKRERIKHLSFQTAKALGFSIIIGLKVVFVTRVV